MASPWGTALSKQAVQIAALKAVSGKDIHRKGSTRKAKFLFSLPGSLATTKGGTIGKVSGMDTGCPVLHISFPEVCHV